MTLPELGKLADFNYDQNFENWPPIDPPSPLNVNLTPLWGKFFSTQLFKTFLHFRPLLDLVTIPYDEKSMLSLFLRPLGGQKCKYGSKLLKTSRKVVTLRSKNFHCIFEKNKPPNFKITPVSQHRKLRFSWFYYKKLIGFFKSSAENFLSRWKEMSADDCI